jgi:hypothetical protein
MTTILRLWRQHRLALIGFVLAAAVTLVFALRTITGMIYWSDPAHRNQRLEGWMTPFYIARSWHVPPQELGKALALDPPKGRPLRLEDIARTRGQPLDELIAEVETAIEVLRKAQPADAP